MPCSGAATCSSSRATFSTATVRVRRSLAGLASVRVLAPVLPSKIVAVGLNYRDHAAEQGKPLPAEPLIFLKPSTSVIGPGEAIRLPPGVGRVDHEAEAGLVIKRTRQRVQAARAHEYVLGVTCVNDVTARDMQRRRTSTRVPRGSTPLLRSGLRLPLDWICRTSTCTGW